MGYCVWSEESTISIKKENMQPLLQMLSDYFKSRELRWVDGFDIEDMFSDEDDDEPLTLENIWEDLRYEYTETDTHYIINEFLGEKLGDDFEFFELIAPFCEDGYIQFNGEDGEKWRYVIQNKECKEVYPTISWK